MVVASETGSALQFGSMYTMYAWYYYGGAFGLADVSLTPLPAPTLQALTPTNNSITFTWNAVTGMEYRVQYKHDLNATNWSNLGNAITATNAILSASDAMTQTQRFYRVILTP